MAKIPGLVQLSANTTPYLAELFVATDKSGRKRCVVVVKATFSVEADGECRPDEQQVPFVAADEHHGDPGSSSTRHESDFAPTKPHADVLVDASAIAPDGRAVPALEVALRGPGLVKRAVVTGDRTWIERFAGIEAAPPQPFSSMPLVYDRAFGGSDGHEAEPRNPSGVGFHARSDRERILGSPLPNIERPDAMIRSWSDRPAPIGFGSVGRGWQPRIRLAGTYDRRWFDDVRPFLPADFDDRYHQSAPLDQQIAQLSPGAVFECVHMSPGGRFIARLPTLSVPVRFLFDDRHESSTITPDTLILRPGSARVVLLGRTGVQLPRKLTALREVHVGPLRPHYKNLGEAVTALQKRQAGP